MKHIVFLGLGSNLSNPKRQVEKAIKALARLPYSQLLKQSSLYPTKPWGKTDQPDFINAVVKLQTDLDPEKLLTHTQRLEKDLGRQLAQEKWSARIIDIDILLYDNLKINSDRLTIPHPYMKEREFVIKPLLEIEPDLQLIIFGN